MSPPSGDFFVGYLKTPPKLAAFIAVAGAFDTTAAQSVAAVVVITVAATVALNVVATVGRGEKQRWRHAMKESERSKWTTTTTT